MSNSKDAYMALPCKKCKILPNSGLTCLKCNSLSHPSCIKLLRNIKYISDKEIICCDRSEDQDEVSPRDMWIRTFVIETISPLLEEIKLLRQEVMSLKKNNDTVDAAVAPLRLEIKTLSDEVKCLRDSNLDLVKLFFNSPNANSNSKVFSKSFKLSSSVSKQPKHDNIYDKQLMKGHPPSANKSALESDINVYNNIEDTNVVSGHSKSIPANVDDKTNDIVSVHKKQLPANVVDKTNDDQGPWSTQRRRRFKKRATITGTSTDDNNSSFTSSYVKRAWFYIGKVDKDAEIDAIKTYIGKRLKSSDVELIIEKLPAKGNFQAFKLGVPFIHKEVLQDSEFWPKGIILRRFNFPKTNFL
ncbi:hypothetical protein Zmor_011890 [Zophobas morio]|uniref:Uncharacterized protein n=1 Tax=Zophobas morio TaxID=2755281 RepID=A0AA38HJI5_9CUCU|nr:hypothetical protein Zmor_011890 [Zophobas morio]